MLIFPVHKGFLQLIVFRAFAVVFRIVINFSSAIFLLQREIEFMRLLVTILFMLQLQQLTAQTDSSSILSPIQYPVKGFVILNNREKIIIEGITILNSDSVILFTPGSNMINGAYTFKGDVRTMAQQRVAAPAIKLVRVKRQSFASGAAVGAVSGFVLGYLAGAVSYRDDLDDTEEENDDSRNARAVIFGFGTAIPTALAGGAVGGIFIKKRFRVHGDKHRLQSILNKVN